MALKPSDPKKISKFVFDYKIFCASLVEYKAAGSATSPSMKNFTMTEVNAALTCPESFNRSGTNAKATAGHISKFDDVGNNPAKQGTSQRVDSIDGDDNKEPTSPPPTAPQVVPVETGGQPT